MMGLELLEWGHSFWDLREWKILVTRDLKMGRFTVKGCYCITKSD